MKPHESEHAEGAEHAKTGALNKPGIASESTEARNEEAQPSAVTPLQRVKAQKQPGSR